jgi:hypothetical protein
MIVINTNGVAKIIPQTPVKEAINTCEIMISAGGIFVRLRCAFGEI